VVFVFSFVITEDAKYNEVYFINLGKSWAKGYQSCWYAFCADSKKKSRARNLEVANVKLTKKNLLVTYCV
jgi:hypothetical protein